MKQKATVTNSITNNYWQPRVYYCCQKCIYNVTTAAKNVSTTTNWENQQTWGKALSQKPRCQWKKEPLRIFLVGGRYSASSNSALTFTPRFSYRKMWTLTKENQLSKVRIKNERDVGEKIYPLNKFNISLSLQLLPTSNIVNSTIGNLTALKIFKTWS